MSIFGSLIAMSAIATVAILLIIYLRPDQDNTMLITTVLGFFAPTVVALIAVLKVDGTATKVNDLHHEVNSRMTELVEAVRQAARAAGREEGIAEQVKTQEQTQTAENTRSIQRLVGEAGPNDPPSEKQERN